MKKKITYIISHVNKALGFEWTADLLDKEKFELSFILLNKRDTDFEKYLIDGGFRVKQINYKNKFDTPKAFVQIFLHLLNWRQTVLRPGSPMPECVATLPLRVILFVLVRLR